MNVQLEMIFYVVVIKFAFLENDCLSAEAILAPKLNVTVKYVDVPLDSSYYLKCTGPYPLNWIFEEPQMTYRWLLKNHTTSVNANTESFESSITLKFRTYEDTGRYICAFENGTLRAFASIYIFVNDFEHLLLPVPVDDHFFRIIEGEQAVVPCLSTHSGAYVTFWKGSCGNESVPIDEVSFNPTIGFVIRHPTGYFEGRFCCMAELRNQIKNFDFILNFIDPTQVTPDVEIVGSANLDVIKNESFILKCIIKVQWDIKIVIKWNFKSAAAARVATVRPIQEQSSESYPVATYTDTLTVTNVQKEDEGFYECCAFCRSQKMNCDHVYVKVLELTKPHFTKTNMNSPEVVASTNENLRLFCYADGVPKPEVTWYRNSELLGDKALEVIFDDDSQTMIIYRLLKNYSGCYECRAENTVGNASLTTTLIVSAGLEQSIAVHPRKNRSGQIAAFVAALAVFSVSILVLIFGKKLHSRKKKGAVTRLYFCKVPRERLTPQTSVPESEISLDDEAELFGRAMHSKSLGQELKFDLIAGQHEFGRTEM